MTAAALVQPPLRGEMMSTVKEPLNKFEAGKLIRQRREQLGYTQDDVVANTTITVATYVSELENGKVSVGRSKHFASLAKYLKLSEEDIRSITPGAVFSMTVGEDSTEIRAQKPKRPISDSLKEAAAIYGGRFPDLTTPLWQDYLESFRPRGVRADTPEAWLDLYRDLAKHGITPGRN